MLLNDTIQNKLRNCVYKQERGWWGGGIASKVQSYHTRSYMIYLLLPTNLGHCMSHGHWMRVYPKSSKSRSSTSEISISLISFVSFLTLGRDLSIEIFVFGSRLWIWEKNFEKHFQKLKQRQKCDGIWVRIYFYKCASKRILLATHIICLLRAPLRILEKSKLMSTNLCCLSFCLPCILMKGQNNKMC